MHPLRPEIISILDAGQDLTVATLRPDGWPQATKVGYVSDGLDIYFGASAQSQKADNIAHDDRVSLTVDLPYRSWDEIRGLSLSGRARRVTDPAELAHANELFLLKFPEVMRYVAPEDFEFAVFHIAPEFVSLLDYRKGFGNTELVLRSELDQPTAGAGGAV